MNRTLTLLLSVGPLLGCEAGSIANEPLPPLERADAAEDTRSSAPAHDAGQADTAGAQRDDAGAGANPNDSGPMYAAPGPDGLTEAGVAPRPPATESRIGGSAAANHCTSYSERSGERCYGFWCGVSEQVIAAELPPSGPCSGLTPKMLCEGAVQTRLQTCATSIRSDLLTLLESEAVLRVKMQECFYEDARFTPVGADCLACFLEGGECAGRNCVTECLASGGRSAACDQCRFDHNCFQPLPACAGLPSPF